MTTTRSVALPVTVRSREHPSVISLRLILSARPTDSLRSRPTDRGTHYAKRPYAQPDRECSPPPIAPPRRNRLNFPDYRHSARLFRSNFAGDSWNCKIIRIGKVTLQELLVNYFFYYITEIKYSKFRYFVFDISSFTPICTTFCFHHRKIVTVVKTLHIFKNKFARQNNG